MAYVINSDGQKQRLERYRPVQSNTVKSKQTVEGFYNPIASLNRIMISIIIFGLLAGSLYLGYIWYKKNKQVASARFGMECGGGGSFKFY